MISSMMQIFRRSPKPPAQSESDKTELFSTLGDYGLRTLSESQDDIVDIVFVHGLTGNRESTWRYKKEIFWPQDLLAKELPNARIFTFGYDANIVGLLKTAGSDTLRDHGKALATDVAMRRIRTDSNKRPLIFVAHSLGGLVVEQALLISRGSAQQHVKDLLESTIAIAFMGTPHLGARKADWAGPVLQLSKVVRTTNTDIVAVLEPGSEVLANLQQEFHTMLDDRSRNESKFIDIFCFFEEVAYPGIGLIVPKQSAILPAYPNNNIHANHVEMTKFVSDRDAGYVRVRDQLWLWYDGVRKNQDEWRARQTEGSSRGGGGSRPAQGSLPSLNSGGGPIFFGNQTAGRDVYNVQYHQGAVNASGNTINSGGNTTIGNTVNGR